MGAFHQSVDCLNEEPPPFDSSPIDAPIQPEYCQPSRAALPCGTSLYGGARGIVQSEQRQGESLVYLTVTPDDYDPEKAYPTVILLHGYGANMNDLAGLCPAIERERYIFVCPNAPIPVQIGPGKVGYAWTPPGSVGTSEDGERAEDMLNTLFRRDHRGAARRRRPYGPRRLLPGRDDDIHARPHQPWTLSGTGGPLVPRKR